MALLLDPGCGGKWISMAASRFTTMDPTPNMITQLSNIELIGIIQVPLSAFVYDPFVGRGHDPVLVKQLDRVFRRTQCAPEKPSNHAEGAIDRDTISVILSKLQVSLTNFRKTITSGKHPKVRLPSCILCIDGTQRIAAAKARYGEKYWWTVRLFYCKGGEYTSTRSLYLNH